MVLFVVVVVVGWLVRCVDVVVVWHSQPFEVPIREIAILTNDCAVKHLCFGMAD